MLLHDVKQTMGIIEHSIKRAHGLGGDIRAAELYLESLGLVEAEKQGIIELQKSGSCKVDPVVSFLIGATNGIAYKHLIGRLNDYPIPELPLPKSSGERFLDVGCNWGRWCIAAERLGYVPVGIDPSLGAIMAAKRVAKQLKLSTKYIVGDGRFLPFPDRSFDVVFSYSVLQHLSYENVKQVLSEISRVLKPNGRCLIQMPNRWGARCLYHQAKRGFRKARDFEVSYWSIRELKKEFGEAIGNTKIFVDCYFGLGLQKADIPLMPVFKRFIIHFSEFLKPISRKLFFLVYMADSVFVESRK
ncbi:MAG: class I SAM-dependent methyltransferase [Thermodesulfobacteriota bacterium]